MQWYGGKILNATGGSLQAIFDDPTIVDKLLNKVQEQYHKATYTASITGTFVDFEGKLTRDTWVESGRKLRFEKLTHDRHDGNWLAQPLEAPYIRTCSSCGLLPAYTFQTLEDEWLCRSCENKRVAFKELRVASQSGKFYPFAKFLAAARQVNATTWQGDLAEPEELDDLAVFSHPSNYMGLIYADVNRLGQLFRAKLSDPEEQVPVLSQIVEQSMRNALARAVQDDTQLHPQPHPDSEQRAQGKRMVPFLIIIMGGDDLTLIVPAHTAVPLANRLCRYFSEEIQQLSLAESPVHELDLSMSAGIVLVGHTYPLWMAFQMTKELARSAKRLSAQIHQQNKKEIGSIDFRVITTSSARPLQVQRQMHYQRPFNIGLMHLTCSPYVCASGKQAFDYPTADALIETIYELKRHDFPTNKLQQWASILDSGSDAEIDLKFSLFRSRLTSEMAKVLKEGLSRLDVTDQRPYRRLPYKPPDYFYSPLLDVQELYGFVQGPRAEQPDD